MTRIIGLDFSSIVVVGEHSAVLRRLLAKGMEASRVWMGLFSLNDLAGLKQLYAREASFLRTLPNRLEAMKSELLHRVVLRWDDGAPIIQSIADIDRALDVAIKAARGAIPPRERGRPSRTYEAWRHFMAELIALGLTDLEIADLVLASDHDWRPRPCSSVVGEYSAYDATVGPGEARKRLQGLFSTIRSRAKSRDR